MNKIDNGLKKLTESSSVVRGVGWEATAPLIGLSTKAQNKKNTTFFAFLRLFFALELTKKWFEASFETYTQGG